MKVGSLFTGIGGFDLGFERAGMEVAWQCEIDPHARAVLAKHWPGVPCYDDVRSIAGGAVPDVDLICGGFPCQDVSVAGRRAGLAGERSGLWFEFHRVLAELRPNWVVIENVPGLRSSNAGADLWVILRGLAELGYMGAFWSPDAQWFGVAQRRARVFIVGYLGDGRAVEVLPIPEGMCGNPPARRATGEGASYDVAPRLTGSGRGTARTGESRGQDPIGITRRGRGDGTADEVEQSGVAPALRTYGGGSSIPAVAGPITATYAKTADNTFSEPPNLVVAIQDTRAMEKAQGGSGVSEAGVSYTLDTTGAQGVYVPDVVGTLDTNVGGKKLDVQGAMQSHYIVGTATASWARGAGNEQVEAGLIQTTHGRPRRLTPTECIRLQGFPDSWQDVQWSHANASETNASEILRCLWRSTYTWAREGWGLGEPSPLLTPEVLLAGVHGGWVSWEVAGECAARAREIQGEDPWPEGFLRELRKAGANRPAPHRRESFEQLARELGRPLQELPLTEAQAVQAVLNRGVREEASAEWPVRPSLAEREARGPLSDSHRYKQLGNAVAVPVVEWIGRRIVAATENPAMRRGFDGARQ